jgi:flagellin
MSVINTNIKSLMAQDSLTINNRSLTQSMQRLSTGLKINSAADDAAGLGISTRMDAQVRGLNMAIKNANDTISMVQTAEGAMQEVTSILQRMRELSVQSASDTNGSVDRAYLQAEVSQLSSEIDRISNTTQWNSMNILDGSYKNKLFQIGANQGQTIGLSIGSMNSRVLGVATSATADMAGVQTPGVQGVSAAGVGATPTVVKLGFTESDTYKFKLYDGDTTNGLVYDATANGLKLDLTSAKSKQDFVDSINKGLAESATDTVLTGSAVQAATIDMTKAENANALKFNISLDGGVVQQVDLTADALAKVGNAGMATLSKADIESVLQAKLQSLFDDSVSTELTTAPATADQLKITDAKGRQITVSQGGGDGTLFGTDAANDGALKADATKANTVTASWDGDNLMLTNSSGGRISVSDFEAATATNGVLFDVVSDSQSGQNFDPVMLNKTAYSDAAVMATAKVESSSLAITFNDTIGNGTSSTVSFDLTTGNGDTLGSVSALELNGSDADTVKKAIHDALVAGIETANLEDSDNQIDVDDFTVNYVGNTLTISNSNGLAMRVENYSSAFTTATVTPMNELGASEVLASQPNYYSSLTLQLGSGWKNDLSANTTLKYDLYVDGKKEADAIDLSGEFNGAKSGADIAKAIADKIIAKDGAIAVKDATGTDTAAKHVLKAAQITATYDAVTGSINVFDSLGRSIRIVAASTNTLGGSGVLFANDDAQSVANKNNTINTASVVAQGDTYEATELTVNFSQAKADFTFAINGVYLDSGTNTSAGTSTWDSSLSNGGLTAKLDAMVQELNSVHASNDYEYTVSGSSVTFFNRAGGPLEVSGFKTGTGYDGVTATVTPKAGQGTETVIGYNEALQTAYAAGDAAVATTATLRIQSSDLIGLSVSDGTNSYVLDQRALDITDLTSSQNFADAVNQALAGSSITATMDTKGNLVFSDSTGGQISLTSFTSAKGLSATWAPQAGQGDTTTISNGYAGEGVPAVVAAPVAGGSGSVAQISITTQSGASAAMAVIDNALTYVNSERAKLGAVENRLTHTIDNLTNIVTNTQASKSRITDTDYAQETSKLARAQIIQQAATAMLAQANQAPQSVLALLK